MLPKKLKGFNVRVNGATWIGDVESVELPGLKRKSEDWRGGGMDGAVSVDMGQEKLEMTVTCGGLMAQGFDSYGEVSVNKLPLMFYGSYEDDDGVHAVEIETRGRFTEIELGTAKAGDNTSHKFKADLAYYKITIDGTEYVEIDLPGMVFKVKGVDRLEQRRQALMLS